MNNTEPIIKLEIVQYSKYSIAVFGANYMHIKELKEAGGRYNKNLTHSHTHDKGPGWIFKLNQREIVRNILKIA
jgi:hypothetical protein